MSKSEKPRQTVIRMIVADRQVIDDTRARVSLRALTEADALPVMQSVDGKPVQVAGAIPSGDQPALEPGAPDATLSATVNAGVAELFKVGRVYELVLTQIKRV
jgi:hypothetical protein